MAETTAVPSITNRNGLVTAMNDVKASPALSTSNTQFEGSFSLPPASSSSSPSHSTNPSVTDNDQQQQTNTNNNDDDNSTQHSLSNYLSFSNGPTDFSELNEKIPSSLANISANIELHPQNYLLGGTANHQYIKRPLNAYMIWIRQERKRARTDEPKKKMNEVSKVMGERWKSMSPLEKKPYFDLARKYSEEHKQVLQDHPELQYAPSKKKGPKGSQNQKDEKHSIADSSVQSQTVTPAASPRSLTPRQGIGLIPSTTPLNQVFSPFPTPINSGFGLQPSQQFQINTPTQGIPHTPGVLPVFTPQTTSTAGLIDPQQQFLSPPSIPTSVNRNNSSALIGQMNQQQVTTTPGRSAATVSLALEQYYTSLCQPAFPSFTESPMNGPFANIPPYYFLDQYNQHVFSQSSQEQQQGTFSVLNNCHQQNGVSSPGTGGGPFSGSSGLPHYF